MRNSTKFYTIALIWVIVWMVIWVFMPSRKPSIQDMTEGQLIDQMRSLQNEKDKQVDRLSAEETMQFIQWDESRFASINQKIQELSWTIATKQSKEMPKYEIIRKSFIEMQAKAKEVEKTPSQLLEDSLGL